VADVDVAPAQRRDVSELASVLARAFYADPVMMWIAPDDSTREKALTTMFATITRRHFLRTEGVEVARGDPAGRIGAAALWDPPGKWKQSRLQELLMIPCFVRAFGSVSRRGQQVAELMKRHHPAEPHWYLGVIGSDPAVRGTGFGQALMRSRLDRCDAEYAPAYLESSNPDNIPYYQRFGFAVTGEIKVPDGGPSMWPMWRQPRQS
jgi:ribosomal protein S18 acetylase RimI-like enzyme